MKIAKMSILLWSILKEINFMLVNFYYLGYVMEGNFLKELLRKKNFQNMKPEKYFFK